MGQNHVGSLALEPFTTRTCAFKEIESLYISGLISSPHYTTPWPAGTPNVALILAFVHFVDYFTRLFAGTVSCALTHALVHSVCLWVCDVIHALPMLGRCARRSGSKSFSCRCSSCSNGCQTCSREFAVPWSAYAASSETCGSKRSASSACAA